MSITSSGLEDCETRGKKESKLENKMRGNQLYHTNPTYFIFARVQVVVFSTDSYTSDKLLWRTTVFKGNMFLISRDSNKEDASVFEVNGSLYMFSTSTVRSRITGFKNCFCFIMFLDCTKWAANTQGIIFHQRKLDWSESCLCLTTFSNL